MKTAARQLHVMDDNAETVLREFQERRRSVQTGAPVVHCAACWRRVTVASTRVEVVDGRAYHRCPYCNGISMIRWDDAHKSDIAERAPND